jgi:hypothetical protein
MQTRLCKGKQMSEAIKAPDHVDAQTAAVWGFRLSRNASRSSRSAHIADHFNKGQTSNVFSTNWEYFLIHFHFLFWCSLLAAF